jgi:RNA polymerase sigma-70 factor, ECF subfamily
MIESMQAHPPGRRRLALAEAVSGAGGPTAQEMAMARVQPVDRDRRATFAAHYQTFLTPVYRYLYARIGNRDDAEDLTAAVFTEALAGWSRYRERGEFEAWLFTIVRRRLIDYRRRSRPTVTLDAVEALVIAGADPADAAVRTDQLRELAAAVARLSDADQDLLGLRFAADLGYREIGTILGRSEDAVKMAVHRLLERLETQWEVSDVPAH